MASAKLPRDATAGYGRWQSLMHVDSADCERQFWIRNAGVRCSSHLGSTIVSACFWPWRDSLSVWRRSALSRSGRLERERAAAPATVRPSFARQETSMNLARRRTWHLRRPPPETRRIIHARWATFALPSAKAPTTEGFRHETFQTASGIYARPQDRSEC